MSVVEGNRCPVCAARFRGASTCSRCQADLSQIMQIAANAWWLREAARKALAAGDFKRAAAFATEAQQAHATPAGEALQTLASWL